MGYAKLCCFVLLSLFVTFGYSQTQVLYYVYNPDCSSAGGCDLLAQANWNGTFNSNSSLVIIANETSTFTLTDYGTLFLESLTFGMSGAPVTVRINNSTLGTNSASSVGLQWNGTGALYTTDSTIAVLGFVTGGNLFSTNTEFYSSFISVSQVKAVGGEFGGVEYGTTVINGTFTNVTLDSSGDFNAQNLFIYNCTIEIDTLRVSNYTLFQDCDFNDDMTLYAYNNSIVEIQDSSANITELYLGVDSRFAFYSDNSNSSLIISAAAGVDVLPVGSEVYLGDNVVALIEIGALQNLTLGSNVQVHLGDDYNPLYIRNIQQLDSDSFTSIVTSGYLYLANIAPITASIYVTGPNGQLNVFSLFLSNGSSIYGDNGGRLNMHGILHCPTCNVSLPVEWWSDFTGGDLVVDTLYAPNITYDSYGGANGTVYGDVFLVPLSPYDTFSLGYNSFFVNGSFTRVGGYLNVTINKNTDPKTPFVQVSGAVTLTNVKIVADIGLLLDSKSSFAVIASSSNNLTANGTQILNWDTSKLADKLKLTQSNGALYVQPDGAPNHNKPFLQKWKIGVIVGASVGGALVLIIIILVVKKLRSRKHYTRIAH